MLQELTIRDFAIIDKLDIDFRPQMTVLTGETGAGKSIIIDALGLLAGGRASVEFVRLGANKAMIQGQFVLPKDAKTFKILAELGIEPDEVLILERDLYQSGRNTCRINGHLVNLSSLRRVGETLIDIHGQNEHQELMHPETHIKLLDEFDSKLQALHKDYLAKYQDYRQLKAALAKREADEKAWAQRLDMLEFQVQEIEAAVLQANEEEQLLEEKNKLDNFQTINTALETGYQILTGENLDVVGNLGNAMSELDKIANLSPELEQISEKVADAFYSLQDVSRDISNQLDQMEWDEDRLNQIEQRLELIHQLKRKYGDSVAQILEYYEKIRAELSEMQATEIDASKQEAAVEAAYQAALSLAQKLSAKRKQSAQVLEGAVKQQLSALYMDKAVFKVKFFPVDELTENGTERVEFYIQTNLGEAMGPLAKIASGGELSRIMLALKTIFAQKQGVTSIIFDEVDTGV
ncbi:MAG: DNA repair protein RecN, partial [Ligilactobacillus agilis]|nr:DNA repair protein RecN [Ligilactobacillus agilis]